MPERQLHFHDFLAKNEGERELRVCYSTSSIQATMTITTLVMTVTGGRTDRAKWIATALGLSDFTMDVYVDKRAAWIVDFSVWASTDPLLYSWKELESGYLGIMMVEVTWGSGGIQYK